MKNAILIASAILPSPIRVLILKAMGANIGVGVRLGIGSLIIFKDKLHIGKHTKIGSAAVLICDKAEIGQYSEITPATLIKVPKVKIGRDCKISFGSILRSGHTTQRSELVMGDLVHVFPFAMIDCSRKVEIQDGTGIGPHCSIFTHSSYKSVLQGYNVTYADVRIGSRVELTYNVFVAPGVSIGDDAICAYGAYVNKDVEPGVMVAGMPAKVKRTRDQFVRNLDQSEKIATLDAIIEDYRNNIQILSGRLPIDIQIVTSEEDYIIPKKAAYVLLDSSLRSPNSGTFAVFDVTRGVAYNRGLDKADYMGIRKYLSRYGIRFLSEGGE